MALKRRLTWNSALALTAVAVLSFSLGGCSRATFRPDPELMDRVCTASDLDGSFVQQTSGSVSAENLAALSDDPERRREELEAAGLEWGHFVYWKEVVGRPPFPPQIEVLCQVLMFETAEQASAFVRQLDEEPETLVTVALQWLPEEERRVTEVRDVPAALPEGSRLFQMVAGADTDRVALFIVFTAHGSVVNSTYMGSRNGTLAAEDAVDVHARTLARLEQAGATR